MFLKIIKVAWKIIETLTVAIPFTIGLSKIWKKKDS